MNLLASRSMTLLLTLLLLAPGTGLAGSLGTTPRSLRLLEAPEAPVTGALEPSRPHPALRIGAELGLGTLTGLGMALVGARIGTSLCPPQTDEVPDGCTLYPLAGAWMGSSLGFALGVWGGGSLLGGRGHLLHTLGGMAVGLLVGAGTYALSRPYVIVPTTGLTLLLPYVLSVVAFELSSAHLQPLLSFSPRGGTVLGLAGSF